MRLRLVQVPGRASKWGVWTPRPRLFACTHWRGFRGLGEAGKRAGNHFLAPGVGPSPHHPRRPAKGPSVLSTLPRAGLARASVVQGD